MATSRVFAYNPSPNPLIPGTEQVGSIAAQSGSVTIDPSLEWWNGPNEDSGYIIAYVDSGGDRPNAPERILGTQYNCHIGFFRSEFKTEESFVELARVVSGSFSLTTGTGSKEYLNSIGLWTSYSRFLVSKGTIVSNGFQIGDIISKDMGISSWNYVSSGTPNSTSFNLNASYWSDWGEDIFDSWGYFYLYDPSSGTYLGLQFDTVNQADGVFSEQTFSLSGRSFTIVQGYPVQGIFKFEIRCPDGLPFVFGEAGNMGSDGSTANVEQTFTYSIGGQNLTLWYNENYQTNNINERFFSYYIPFIVEENDTKTYTKLLNGSDNLYLYSRECTYGLTVYHSKRYDVKEWVTNDIEFGD
jgi:hypothetical protein